MIDFSKIAKIALPIIGNIATSVMMDENKSPIKQESPFETILVNSIKTLSNVVDPEQPTQRLCQQQDQQPIMYYPVQQYQNPIVPYQTGYDIAINRKYKWDLRFPCN